MKKYSIVIPTYNKCDEFLKPCIESVIKNSDLNQIDICVSVNGCIDNTLEYLQELKKQYPNNIKWCWSDEPLGYARAVNAGIKISETEFVVLLNNDTAILDFASKNEWLDRLNAPFNTDIDAGVTGVLTEYNDITKMEFLIFFCVMMRKKLFEEIGFLDTEFRIGGREDIEFCYRVAKAGYNLTRVSTIQNFSNDSGAFTTDFPIYHVAEGTMFDKSLVDVDFDELRKEHNELLFKKTRAPIPKKTERPKIVLKHTYGGLGDNLCHSTLPEMFTRKGFDVYISLDQEYRNSEVKTLIDMNPFIKGYTSRPHNMNVDKYLETTYPHNFWNKSYQARIEQAIFGTFCNEYPKIYYQPILLPEWQDKTFVDISSVSDPHPTDMFMTHIKENNNNVIVQNFDYKTKNIFDYINIIYSCKKFICVQSGGNSLAAAINRKNTECYMSHYWIENILKSAYYYHFSNINYICPTNPECSIINVQ